MGAQTLSSPLAVENEGTQRCIGESVTGAPSNGVQVTGRSKPEVGAGGELETVGPHPVLPRILAWNTSATSLPVVELLKPAWTSFQGHSADRLGYGLGTLVLFI